MSNDQKDVMEQALIAIVLVGMSIVLFIAAFSPATIYGK
jgi:hypothetical protein